MPGKLTRTHKMVQSPSAYIEGYAKARLYDQAAADNYIRHTNIGDPVLDPVLEEISSLRRPTCTGSSRLG